MKTRYLLAFVLVIFVSGASAAPYGTDEHTWALYHFEDNYQDSSGNNRHLNVVDHGSYFGFADSRPGWDLGKALNVTGSSDDGSSISSSELRYPGTGDWAVETMIFAPGAAQMIVHYSEGVAQHDPYQMGLNSSGTVDWRIDQQDGTRVGLTGQMSLDTWHHVAAVYDESESITRLYIDFVEVDSATVTSIENRQQDNVYIGSISFGARGPVYMDELRISTTARVPEPATLGLVLMGGLVLLRRRKR